MTICSCHTAPSRRRSLPALFLGLLVAVAVVPPPAGAQTGGPADRAAPASPDSAKKVLEVGDYSRWRTVEDQSISSDGKWATWVYRFTNVAQRDEKPELHILNLDTNQDVTVADGHGGVFSPDGRWIVYQIDSLPPRSGRGGRGGGGAGETPAVGGRSGGSGSGPTHRMELRELATGKTHVWHDMQSATFNQASTFVLVRNRPAGGGRGFGRGGFGGGRGGGGSEPAARGSDAILFELGTGRSQLLGSAGDASFNRAGTMLAYTVDAQVRDGNGLFVVNLASGATRALDNDARIYGRLAWNDPGTGLAVLKGKEVQKMLERDNVLLVVPDVRAAVANPTLAPATLDTTAAGFPDGWVISDRSPLSWSEDGARVFLGAMPQVARQGHRQGGELGLHHRRGRVAHRRPVHPVGADGPCAAGPELHLHRGLRRQAWRVRRAQRLDHAGPADLPDGRWGVGRDDRAYISDWKPARADFYRVNTATGERTLMFEGQLTQGARSASPPTAGSSSTGRTTSSRRTTWTTGT